MAADNLVISLLARRQFDVPRVVARVNHTENEWLFTDRWGVDVAISAATSLMSQIEEATAGADTVGLLQLASAGVRVIETLITDRSRAAGLTLAEVSLPTGTMVATVVRSGEPKVPNGSFRLEVGDEVLVVSESSTVPPSSTDRAGVSSSKSLCRVFSCRSILASTPIERCLWRSRWRGARRATRCRERDLACDRPGVRHGKGPGSCPPDGRRRRDHRAGEPARRARGAWPHRGRAPAARSGQPRRGPELTSSGAGHAGARCPLTTTAASHQAGHRPDQARRGFR